MNKMRALWLENQILSYRDDLPIPEPSEGEVLIRVISAGICATDIELKAGYYPFIGIPGHEFVGSVVKSPSNPIWCDKHVVGEINLPCLECQTCMRGDRNHCEKRQVLGIKGKNGAFAEYLTLPVENIHEVPPSISIDDAVFTEPLAAAMQILNQVTIEQTMQVLVIGAGRLGQLIARVIHQLPCNLNVVARYPAQKRLLEDSGIQTLPESEIPFRKLDLVIDATGSKEGIEIAMNAVRPKGIIILKTTTVEKVILNLSPIVVNEVTVIGSRCGPFQPALESIVNEMIDPKVLISARFPIENGLTAFHKAKEQGEMKVIIDMT